MAQPSGWVPCASRHFPAASIDIHVERRSPRRPWRYAPEMAAMLGHAMGLKIKSKSSRQAAKRVCAQRTIMSFDLPAFCVAEHRRDCGVERHGCRESLAGPGMAHQGGPHNPEKHRAPAKPATQLGWPFFWFCLFWPIKKDEHGGNAVPYVMLRAKRK